MVVCVPRFCRIAHRRHFAEGRRGYAGAQVTDAPLIITPEVRAALHRLRDAAARKPIDMPELLRQLETARGKRLHMERMTAQTIEIPGPWDFLVTFSIETGHPAGTCRHMSMSIDREGRVPNEFAVWMIAEELGFAGGLASCFVYPEELAGHGQAINVVQPLSVQPAANA
jgi:hypothetical protein